MRCAVLDDYQNVALDMADWSTLRDRVEIVVFNAPIGDAQATVSALKDFDIVCAMRERTAFRRELLEQLPNLKLLVTSGLLNAAIDLTAARDHGITVCGTGWGGTDPTAPLTMALILELTRHVGFESERLKRGALWQSTVGMEIAGKTLGLVGLGQLGSKVAKLAQAFEMNVMAWSANLTPERCAEIGVTYASREELFVRSDIISIHVLLSRRTRGLIGAADLARMKPSSYLVNTARGPIVEQGGLFQLCASERSRVPDLMSLRSSRCRRIIRYARSTTSC